MNSLKRSIGIIVQRTRRILNMSDNLTNPKDLVGINKPRLYTVPPASVVYQALAMQNGAEKYGAYNWREKKVVASIYVDATLRHLYAWLDGEENASDSNLPHLAHALACLGIIVDAKETGNLVDDRPKPGATGALIERYTKRPMSRVSEGQSDKAQKSSMLDMLQKGQADAKSWPATIGALGGPDCPCQSCQDIRGLATISSGTSPDNDR